MEQVRLAETERVKIQAFGRSSCVVTLLCLSLKGQRCKMANRFPTNPFAPAVPDLVVAETATDTDRTLLLSAFRPEQTAATPSSHKNVVRWERGRHRKRDRGVNRSFFHEPQCVPFHEMDPAFQRHCQALSAW